MLADYHYDTTKPSQNCIVADAVVAPGDSLYAEGHEAWLIASPNDNVFAGRSTIFHLSGRGLHLSIFAWLAARAYRNLPPAKILTALGKDTNATDCTAVFPTCPTGLPSAVPVAPASLPKKVAAVSVSAAALVPPASLPKRV